MNNNDAGTSNHRQKEKQKEREDSLEAYELELIYKLINEPLRVCQCQLQPNFILADYYSFRNECRKKRITDKVGHVLIVYQLLGKSVIKITNSGYIKFKFVVFLNKKPCTFCRICTQDLFCVRERTFQTFISNFKFKFTHAEAKLNLSATTHFNDNARRDFKPFKNLKVAMSHSNQKGLNYSRRACQLLTFSSSAHDTFEFCDKTFTEIGNLLLF